MQAPDASKKLPAPVPVAALLKSIENSADRLVRLRPPSDAQAPAVLNYFSKMFALSREAHAQAVAQWNELSPDQKEGQLPPGDEGSSRLTYALTMIQAYAYALAIHVDAKSGKFTTNH